MEGFISSNVANSANSYTGGPQADYDGAESLSQLHIEDTQDAKKSKKKRKARAHHYASVPSYVTSASTPNFEINTNYDDIGGQLGGTNSIQQRQFLSESAPALDHTESPENLTIAKTRYAHQKEYMTPVSKNDPTFKSFLTFQNIVPPTAGTQFHTVDQGTSSAKFIRSTMYNVPETESLRKATKLPVAITVRPFAPLLPSEEPVPVVDAREIGVGSSNDPSDIGPPRCHRCRAYMNPAMQHTYHNRFVCNICQFGNNVVPDDYSSAVSFETNQRTDGLVRPELHKGVYDFLVNDIYNVKGIGSKNNVLHHVFLIDISENSIRQGLHSLVADSIRACLYGADNSESGDQDRFIGKIALIAFDKRLKFYNLDPSLEVSQLSILSDLDDTFIPFNEGLFADIEESSHTIASALNHLESLDFIQGTTFDAEPCMGAACRVAMQCLESVGGGKITCLLSTLPSWGPGALRIKENKAVSRHLTDEAEKELFQADNPHFKQLVKDFTLNFVSLDCFIVSATPVDISNIGHLCATSGGHMYRWKEFSFERDAVSFMSTFKTSLFKIRGYQGQLKVRCSNGLQVAQYYGTSSSIHEASIVANNVQDPIIPVLDENQSFTVLFSYDGSLNTKYDCHFQAALLYTDRSGYRKVRVINLVLAVSETLDEVFNFVEEDAVVTTIVRDSLSFLGKQSLSELRNSVNEKLVEVFTQYRAMSELGRNNHRIAPNQLLFPDSLKHLPMYLWAFIRSQAIRDSNTISSDSRLMDAYDLLSMPIERLMYHLYPALVELHSLDEEDCMISYEDSPELDHFLKLPLFKNLNVNELAHGVYILCNGVQIFVWVHPEANILLLKDLFGTEIESISSISPLLNELPDIQTHISLQARNMVRFFNSEILGNPFAGEAGIHIVRHGIDSSEGLFLESFIEDSGNNLFTSGIKYSEYLTNLHKAIKVKLENDKSSNEVKTSVLDAEKVRSSLAQKLAQF